MTAILPATLKDLVESSDWQSRLKAIKKIRDDKLILPELVLSLGTKLIKSNSWQLGEAYWEVCEQVFYASLDCQASDWTKVRKI
jgi:hypothetical protein